MLSISSIQLTAAFSGKTKRIAFLEIEVIVDEEAALFYYCGVNSYPTSFIISPDGEFLAYANGALSLDGFNQFFDYSMSLYEKTDSGAEE